MDTKVYEYLVAVAEKRSVTRAAEQFYLTQPALSRHIAHIEAELGTPLFVRTGSELALTDAGRIYINSAQAILHAEAQAREKLLALRAAHAGGLRILVDPKMHTFFARRVVPRYMAAHPEAPLTISTADADAALSSLHGGMAELALVALPPYMHDSAMNFTILSTDEYLLTTPPDSAAAAAVRAHGFSFAAFASDSFILSRDLPYRAMEQDILTQNHFTPRFVCEVPRVSSALYMVKSGFGNAFMPRRFLEASNASLPAFSMVPPYQFHFAAAYPHAAPFGRPLQDLICLAMEEFGGYDAYLREVAASNAAQ